MRNVASDKRFLLQDFEDWLALGVGEGEAEDVGYGGGYVKVGDCGELSAGLDGCALGYENGLHEGVGVGVAVDAALLRVCDEGV